MAAVAARGSHNSPRLASRMSSPKEPKRNTPIRNEDAKPQQSSLTNGQTVRQSSPHRTETQDAPLKTENENDTNANNSTANSNNTNTTTTNAQPLAPPPRPAHSNTSEAADYFNTVHNTSHYGIEPNPFETSFANPSSELPGKGLLPPLASLTSPSSLLPGGTPGWANSLRSGPLSPAMLTGPTGATDYFSDPHFRGSFPTPNESSLRTGLTPGGGGSMFPAPSPNSQALFASLQSGGATPGTLDFRQTAMNAAAAAKQNHFAITSNPTTQAEGSNSVQSMDQKQYRSSNSQQDQQDPFGQHDTDAANGLFLLAQNGGRNTNQFAVPGQPSHIQTNSQQMNNVGGQSQESSPLTKRAGKNSINSINAGSGDNAELSDSGHSEQAKPSTRARGKKASTTAKAGSKRKAEEPPAKPPPSRRNKSSISSIPDDMDTDDEDSLKLEDVDEKGRKMTDEEKRKNFLERNRVAALKCRQRKKQWLANLQAKVELFSTENDALSASVTQLREEIVNLKSLLLAHKDCAVSQAQGLGGPNMSHFIEGTGNFQNHHTNPYGMAMGGPNGMPPGMQMGMPPQGGPQPGMQRS